MVVHLLPAGPQSPKPFPFLSSWEHVVQPSANEIIHLHIGGCGNRIGNELTRFMTHEHGIDEWGNFYGDTSQGQRMHVYFRESSSHNFTPRSVLADFHSRELNEIKSSVLGRMYDPNNYISLPGNLCVGRSTFPDGFYEYGADLMETISDSVRREVEFCDHLQGFHLSHSLGGGTGSGLGSLVLGKLREEFPSNMINTFTVFPSDKEVERSFESYNALLAMHHLIENSDGTFCFDNEGIHDILKNCLKVTPSRLKMDDFNHQIVPTMSDITSLYRLPTEGRLFSNMTKFATGMVHFPRLHFYTVGRSPIINRWMIQTFPSPHSEVVSGVFQARNGLSGCDPTSGRISTGVAVYRGPLPLSDIQHKIDTISDQIRLTDWIRDGMKLTTCNIPTFGYKTSGTAILNSTSIKNLYIRLAEKFAAMFHTRKYLHNYCSKGLDEMELVEAESNLNDLHSEYEQYTDATYNSEEEDLSSCEEEKESEDEEEESDDEEEEEGAATSNSDMDRSRANSMSNIEPRAKSTINVEMDGLKEMEPEYEQQMGFGFTDDSVEIYDNCLMTGAAHGESRKEIESESEGEMSFVFFGDCEECDEAIINDDPGAAECLAVNRGVSELLSSTKTEENQVEFARREIMPALDEKKKKMRKKRGVMVEFANQEEKIEDFAEGLYQPGSEVTWQSGETPVKATDKELKSSTDIRIRLAGFSKAAAVPVMEMPDVPESRSYSAKLTSDDKVCESIDEAADDDWLSDGGDMFGTCTAFASVLETESPAPESAQALYAIELAKNTAMPSNITVDAELSILPGMDLQESRTRDESAGWATQGSMGAHRRRMSPRKSTESSVFMDTSIVSKSYEASAPTGTRGLHFYGNVMSPDPPAAPVPWPSPASAVSETPIPCFIGSAFRSSQEAVSPAGPLPPPFPTMALSEAPPPPPPPVSYRSSGIESMSPTGAFPPIRAYAAAPLPPQVLPVAPPSPPAEPFAASLPVAVESALREPPVVRGRGGARTRQTARKSIPPEALAAPRVQRASSQSAKVPEIFKKAAAIDSGESDIPIQDAAAPVRHTLVSLRKEGSPERSGTLEQGAYFSKGVKKCSGLFGKRFSDARLGEEQDTNQTAKSITGAISLESALEGDHVSSYSKGRKILVKPGVRGSRRGPDLDESAYHSFIPDIELPEQTDNLLEDSSSDSEGYHSGISTPVSSVVTGPFKLDSASIEALFGILVQLENMEGEYWELNSQLGPLLFVSVDGIKDILTEAGIKSMGARVSMDVHRLVASLITLVRLLLYFSVTPPMFKEYEDLLKPPRKKQDTWSHLRVSPLANQLKLLKHAEQIYNVLVFYNHMLKEHPLVYSILELGHSWVEVSLKMLGVSSCETDKIF